MYSAVPCATRRTFAYVKSSAMMPRHPSVPNLMSEVIWSGSKVTGFACPPERLDDLPHVLRARSRAHEKRVFRVDDDHVLEADRGDEAPLAEDHASACIDQDRLSLHRVAPIVSTYAVTE